MVDYSDLLQDETLSVEYIRKTLAKRLQEESKAPLEICIKMAENLTSFLTCKLLNGLQNTPMACMLCQFGHMTECHYPLDCEEAQCSHLERYGVERTTPQKGFFDDINEQEDINVHPVDIQVKKSELERLFNKKVKKIIEDKHFFKNSILFVFTIGDNKHNPRVDAVYECFAYVWHPGKKFEMYSEAGDVWFDGTWRRVG